jgi:hypothetical protein
VQTPGPIALSRASPEHPGWGAQSPWERPLCI